MKNINLAKTFSCTLSKKFFCTYILQMFTVWLRLTAWGCKWTDVCWCYLCNQRINHKYHYNYVGDLGQLSNHNRQFSKMFHLLLRTFLVGKYVSKEHLSRVIFLCRAEVSLFVWLKCHAWRKVQSTRRRWRKSKLFKEISCKRFLHTEDAMLTCLGAFLQLDDKASKSP